jgi:GNAT superfamily N-acetyltransferase
MKIDINNDISDKDLDAMKEVYQSVGWNKHTTEVIKQVFEASNVKVILKCDGRIAGFGRAISDGVFNAAIYDVVVHKDFQRKGLAAEIMKALLTELQDVSCVHLISTTGKEEFYRNVGFRQVKTGMARYLNDVLVDEYLE